MERLVLGAPVGLAQSLESGESVDFSELMMDASGLAKGVIQLKAKLLEALLAGD